MPQITLELTATEARAIAASYGLRLAEKVIAEDVACANGYANTPVSENCLKSRQWCDDHPRSVHTRFTCPRETVAYWYVQQAQEHHLDALCHALDTRAS